MSVVRAINTPSKLHAMPCLHSCNTVGRDAVSFGLREQFVSLWIIARQIEEVYARENDEESTEERDGIDGSRGIEAHKQYEGGENGRRSKSNVVQGVNAFRTSVQFLQHHRSPENSHIGRKLTESFVEVIHLGEDANHNDYDEHVGRRVFKLIVSS